MSDKEITSSSGLSRRTLDQPTHFKPRLKPNSMAAVRRKKLSDGISNVANPATLVFPTDKLGILRGLRKEMLALASKLEGNEAGYALYKETLELLTKHIDARVEQYAPTKLKSRRSREHAPERDTGARTVASELSSTDTLEDEENAPASSSGESTGESLDISKGAEELMLKEGLGNWEVAPNAQGKVTVTEVKAALAKKVAQ